MVQDARSGRLHPAVGAARVEAARALNDALGTDTVAASGKTRAHTDGTAPLILVGLSGGADSLALAATLSHFARRGELRVGAIIVDHQLQEGSARVARTAAAQATKLGLDPVLIETVTVATGTEGPEMAARQARYGAYKKAVYATGARAVALAHTRNDQAETVLLGLARGSGTRSLAGIPRVRTENGVTYLRPILNTTRAKVEDICAAENLTPWHDPTNSDESMMRARVRHRIMPYLEENLGGGVADALARTAHIVAADADYLAVTAEQEHSTVTLNLSELTSTVPGAAQHSAAKKLQVPAEALEGAELVLAMDRDAVSQLHPAVRRRVLAHAVVQAGGETPGFERLEALDDFALTTAKGGPLQMAGHISVYKTRPPVAGKHGKSLSKSGVLVFLRTDNR
ncbi:tRNA lysidine(34) synthetase TilS [Rothia sp. ZJ932]|uniref:tRNA lysidine(34) synthetase TilS n=1 Tax=Rothia sp. ZJ932 TaxID=2810516 RepID=UPI001F071C30|nr:tRNA lysidine(34) synthetase TilS [Rothia sp. ZJ932]